MTTAVPRASPIEPTLFDRVVAYAGLIENHTVSIDNYVKKTTGIVIFCQSFFEQFSKNVLGATLRAFDADAKAVAVHLRLELGDRDLPKQRLIAEFEALCELWDGALGFEYDSSRDDVREFHKNFMPDLLTDIVDWSRTTADTPLIDAASQARDVYSRAIREFGG